MTSSAPARVSEVIAVLFALAVGILIALAPTPAAFAQAVNTAARIVALGDVHGDFDVFVRVLRDAGVIDDKNKWKGGATTLVQTGDVLDRGPASRKVMDLLMDLEKQAGRAGGRVHALIGNHEVMNLVGDLRYVSAGEYAAFASGGSAELRDRAYEVLADPQLKEDANYRQEWMKSRPLGWVEHRQAFGPNGKYGKWIRGHQAVARVNDFIFLHGGISPTLTETSVEAINARVAKELEAVDKLTEGLAVAEDGPFWYRGLAQAPEAELADHVDRVLTTFGVKHVVIGHTVTPGAVVPRFDGKVVMIDVGMSAFYGGPPACLIVENGAAFAMHRGTKLQLPIGGDIVPYLKAAAALDPAPSRILPLIANGGKLPLAGPPAPSERPGR